MIRGRYRKRLFIVFVWLSMNSSAVGVEIEFTRDIRPLLSETCFPCHGPDAENRKSGLRLDVREDALMGGDSGAAAIVPGNLELSELYTRITAEDPSERMPPENFERKLSAEEIETIRLWLMSGAKQTAHWAFQPITSPVVPTVNDSSWPRNPVDHFVLAKLEAQNLVPSPEPDRDVLLRRLALDLTALPVSIEQADNFVANESPDAYEQLVDRLLASPRFGERMALDWLDAARYADTDGYSGDQERSMWLWRNWVIDAFNRNLSFDRFTVEQLAGDLLPNPTVEQKIATGFNRNHRINREPGTIAEEWRIEYVIDRVDATSTVWLGLTMACARCHSHKYDPISHHEFYELFAFFNNVPEVRDRNENGNSPPIVRLSTPQDETRLAELDRQLAQAQATVKELEQSSDGQPEVVESANQALQEISNKRRSLLESIPSSMVMAELAKARDTHLLERGQYDRPGDKVQANVPAALSPLPQDAPRNRLGLARWLVSPTHPLTARVAVNRYWQMYFGKGLVETDEDFGSQGDPPSHPKLLDWLAAEFKQSGWDVKHMHRLIVTSATYRQSSKVLPEMLNKDPFNRWLGRAARFRLPAETIRDQALASSGLLAGTIGGPSVKPYQPPGLWDDVVYDGTYVPDTGENRYRRSLYTFWKRTVPPPAMQTFDAPNRETCKTRRLRTNTPLQALALLNDVTYTEAARSLARNMMDRGGINLDNRLRYGFRRVLAKMPNPEEIHVLRLAWNRYQEIYRGDPESALKLTGKDATKGRHVGHSEMAAYTAVASILLNLDQTITRE